MPRGAPASKLAITVDRDVHAKVVKAAAAVNQADTLILSSAARQAIRLREGLAAVAEWEAAHGAFSDEELALAHARVVSGGATKARTRRSGKRSR